MPNRCSLPSIAPPAAWRAGPPWCELGPHHQRREADPDQPHGGEDRVALPDVPDHHAEGAGQRERDDQDQEDLEEVGEGVRVLERVGGVGVEEAAAVGAESP